LWGTGLGLGIYGDRPPGRRHLGFMPSSCQLEYAGEYPKTGELHPGKAKGWETDLEA